MFESEGAMVENFRRDNVGSQLDTAIGRWIGTVQPSRANAPTGGLIGFGLVLIANGRAYGTGKQLMPCRIRLAVESWRT